jgi:RNA polymerase primary sigma factor
VTKSPRKTQDAPGKDWQFERSEASPASLDLPNDNVPLASEDAENPAEPLDIVEQPGDFVWDEEESEALRQARKDAELTASADPVRVSQADRQGCPAQCRGGGGGRHAHRSRALRR